MPAPPSQSQAITDALTLGSFLGPAVVAAIVSGIVTTIGFVVNRSTSLKMHKQKLDFDRELAERKITADIELTGRKFEFDRSLSEKKVDLEIALAEKKVTLDRALLAWKRKAEFAEEVLADFYEARDILNNVRSPLVMVGEGATRERQPGEAEEETRRLDIYYTTIERLKASDEFFSKLHARRYRFAANFGRAASTPYTALLHYHRQIAVAARMLLDTYQDRNDGSLRADRINWRKVVSWWGSEDPMPGELDNIVSQMEVVCSATIGAGEP